MNQTVSLLFTVVSFFATQAPSRQQTAWRVDKNHSSVSFTIPHMVVSEVTGRFRDFDITMNSSSDDFRDAQFVATLRVDSIDTGSSGRDRHLRADDFFNATQFPLITFTSTSFEKAGETHYAITGNLTIRDVTKKVTWDAELKGMIKGSQGVTAAWRSTLAINRFDYGLQWNRTIESGGLVAGETVTITVVCELRRSL